VRVLILCGGRGIRAFPFTEYLPKPMLPLGGTPVVTQVIKSFIAQGCTEFVLAAGYRMSVLKDYFEGKDLGATIHIEDTGDEADTGERVYACKDLLGDRFMVTYADGLCDVPINRLKAFHNSHGGCATITAVPMFTQYGVLDIGGQGQIAEMQEKPDIPGYWINVGYMVFDQEVFAHWQGTNLEREVLPGLIDRRFAFAYQHKGFFKSVDSYKDVLDFEQLLAKGEVPWRVKELV